MIHSDIAMESVQQTALRVLGPLLRAQPLSPGKVAFAWSVAAGPLLAKHGSPRWTPDGTLRVQASDTAWVAALHQARPVVNERLQKLLGPGAVRRIVIV